MPDNPDSASLLSRAVDFVRSQWNRRPVVGLVLGSGLGAVADLIDVEVSIPGRDIPGYPTSTAVGHRGRVLCGTLNGLPIAVIDGRVHSYEGHRFQDVVAPVRLLFELGIETLLLTNASGAVNPEFSTGDVMIIDDHINLMWGNPLIGPNNNSDGPRFPDLARPYDLKLAQVAFEAAQAEGLTVHRGVYLALAGPTYETPAEYRMVRRIGADVVGMSTVPEVLAAVQANRRVLAISVVSNVFQDSSDSAAEPVTGEQVVATVSAAAERVARTLRRVIQSQFCDPQSS
jgi:purine-nucleoside phosphorylase